MPVTIWMMKAKSVALPNTYHQRASWGTRWVNWGPSILPRPVLSSTHSQIFLKVSFMGRLAPLDGDGLGHDFDRSVIDAGLKTRQRLRRRAGGHVSVLLINTAVAGAHEQLSRGHPTHRTAQMGAGQREGDEFGLRVAAKPGAGLG